MKYTKQIFFIIAAFLCVFAVLSLAACRSEPEPEPTPEPTPRETPPPSTPEPTIAPLSLSSYSGRIEHIFFHEVIAWPEVAFNSDRRTHLDSEYVTAGEFWRILEELYKNDFVLIDLNIIYSEYMTDTGHYKMRQNTFDFPEGKKPLVIFFDNLSFSESLKSYGFMDRYTIGLDGQVWAEGIDPQGNPIVSQDLAAITLLDKFVNENPYFSHNGARGCIALSGVQGILGYRTQRLDEDDSQEARVRRMQEVALVRPIIDKLKATGWYFASHTYGRISLGNTTLENIQIDAHRWFDEVGVLVGDTQILTYPASSRLDGRDQDQPGPAMMYYVGIGFRYFAAYGSQHFVKIKSDDYNITAVIMDRAFICGTTLRVQRNILQRFFEVQDVFDPLRSDEFGNNWEVSNDSGDNDDTG